MAEAKITPVKPEAPLRRATLAGRLVTIAVDDADSDGIIVDAERGTIPSVPSEKRRPRLRRGKGGKLEGLQKFVFDLGHRPELRSSILESEGMSLTGVKSLLRPGEVYRFRLWAAPSDKVIATNVVAGSTVFSPLSLAEWSGILDALFDEYRVDTVRCYYHCVPQNGNNTASFPAGLSLGSDFDSTVTPTSHVQVLTYADGRLHFMQMKNHTGTANQFGFTNVISQYVHESKIPRTVATAGVASAEWLDVGQAWPGCSMHFSNVLGTDGITVYTVFAEYHVSMRVRK